MSPLKWVSLGIAALGAVLIATLIVVFTGTHWDRAGGDLGVILFCSVVAGLILGMMHWLVTGRLDAEIRRLAHHFDALEADDEQRPEFHSRYGFDEVVAAVNRHADDLRGRLLDQSVDRREMEVRLRISDAQRRHLEAILNALSDAVIVTDAFNEVALANEAAADLLGFDLEPSLHEPVERVVRDASLVNLIKDARESGDAGLRRCVEQRLDETGRNAIYDVSLSCVASSNPGDSAPPGASGVVTILRDVTRDREIAETKSDFVSNVSHELRTPLSSIKAYMEMLIDGEAPDDRSRAEFYNVIQGETNRLSRLIDNVLNISRIESGVVRIQRECIELPALVREAVDILHAQARAKRIELIEEPGPASCRVLADRDMLLQAVLNVVGNAIKYTPAGGTITINLGVDPEAHRARVVVRDTGVGIPETDLPHLFDKFYRVADHKNLAPGTGLGLNLVKHVVEAVHGGSIDVTSTIGIGSTFTLALPIADNE